VNNRWIKYLIGEGGKYRQLDPESYNWNDFEEMWKREFFRKRVFNDFLKLEFLPFFKTISGVEKREFFSLFKQEKFSDPYSEEAYNKLTNQNIFIQRVIPNFRFLRLIGSAPARAALKQVVNGASVNHTGEFFYWKVIFDFLQTRHNPSQVKFPVLNRYPNNDNSLNRNLLAIEGSLKTAEDKVAARSSKIFKEIRVGKQLGSGAFGRVYEILGTNRVIKIFDDAVNLEKDITRMERVIDDIYAGTASLEDMPYFESGKIGKTLNYAIMPKLVPLLDDEFFSGHENRIKMLDGLMNKLSFHGNQAFNDPETGVYKEFEIEDYEKTLGSDRVYRISRATNRAKMEWGGRDLHAGNIGFLTQKPDTYIFFDM